ncbi:DNA-binding protein [Streptomyces sp. NE5-10]|uniref:helix-turn-helix domain-containing protein n=1 Tax=Streptomyces sp. NE5-10 TaxID=2759674 RepID=UPI001906EF2B|nr:helix-turn-helix domain-containing protein [Streptomyces sp. NE5-10]GHJ92995.1 DNA-binding protein [Streptomyces sp. NE5-10]
MAAKHLNAPSPAYGLVHHNVRLTTRYVVISNALAQHRELSLLAIGLATHLQSLPAGSCVGIKAIASRFPESEFRIAAAMRELEAHGYLARTRRRLPDGRILPLTISYNSPGADPAAVRETRAAPKPREPRPEPETPPAPAPPPLTPRHARAAELLCGLRAHAPRLLLSERDVRRLAPGVTAWLERGAQPDAVRRTLCADLPHDLAYPAGLLAHRLAALMPPPLPAAPAAPAAVGPAAVGPAAVGPLQNCDDCDRAYRAPEPGRCRGCEAAATAA